MLFWNDFNGFHDFLTLLIRKNYISVVFFLSFEITDKRIIPIKNQEIFRNESLYKCTRFLYEKAEIVIELLTEFNFNGSNSTEEQKSNCKMLRYKKSSAERLFGQCLYLDEFSKIIQYFYNIIDNYFCSNLEAFNCLNTVKKEENTIHCPKDGIPNEPESGYNYYIIFNHSCY